MALARPERAVPRLLTQAVVIPAALSAVVALALVGEVRALISLSRWVQHTDEVITAAHRLEGVLIDRESGFRGYMNVPRDEFLAPYTRSSRVAGETWDRLLQMVADNPSQQARLRALMPLWREWESFVARCIDLRRSDERAARSLERTGFGRERMEGLRAGLGDFVDVEEGLRDERTHRERTWASRIIGGSVAMLLLLGILLGLIARRQLRSVVRGYSGALSAAEQAMELREEFLTVAAHELRTPLTALQLDLQRIRRLDEDRDRAGATLGDQLGTALRQTHRLGSLIESLLDASALAGEAELELHPEELDLAELAREIAGRLRVEFDQLGCAVTVTGGPARGFWDRARLERIVSTLLRNACKYGEGKPVTVAVRQSDAERVLAVADQGIGVPADRLESIFGRFGRAVSARSYGGLGLNLYVARRLAEAHGGRIEVASEEGKGATFTLYLPPAIAGHTLQRAS
ncbi:MAG: CHASE3 domain-containing protein [Myxococcales bacterium]